MLIMIERVGGNLSLDDGPCVFKVLKGLPRLRRGMIAEIDITVAARSFVVIYFLTCKSEASLRR